ncbi:MAG: PAS domain-containing hybrid sensor histidine kinase/response regulator [Pseudomonadota bacterium]
MPIWFVLTAAAIYMAGLFAVAWREDRKASETSYKPNAFIFGLALAVYCTSWTYFGAVGTAAASGWDYLPIYLGPALVFLFMIGTLHRIGTIAKRESVTSLSDFLAARYGKSRAVAALATVAAVIGILPYISLQLKSVGTSLLALGNGGDAAALSGADETVLFTAFALALFAILFGARQTDKTQYNAGLMRVLAIEAMVKIAGLVAVCLLSLALLNGPDFQATETTFSKFELGGFSDRFITLTILSMAAIICLPRQFHVAIIEHRDKSDFDRARWTFPIYLFVTSLVVIPITAAGLTVLSPQASPDLFVLDLPMATGNGTLALFVFLGGFSAATGMVIVSTIALSTMVTNDLVVPALMRSGRLPGLSGDSGARLLSLRRAVIVGILVLAYGYYRAAGSSEALAQTGLISFAAAIQFAPALLGAVYWRTGKRAGVLVGLSIGMALWAHTLFLPAVIGYDAMAGAVPSFFDPHTLFGFNFGDPLTHGVVWSLGLNLIGFVGFSLTSRERLRDRIQAAAFQGDRTSAVQASASATLKADKISPDGLKALASRFLNEDAVDHAFRTFALETGIAASGLGAADWLLVQRTERLLASALGASSARVVLASAIGGQDVTLPDVLSILDHQTQAERFDRHMLQSMLENIGHGISVVDHEQKLVAWNSVYLNLFEYPAGLVKVGLPIEELIQHNIKTGWIDGDPIHQARRRTQHMKAGRSHTYERRNPDGRFLRIVGSPMPGGGYVSAFMDITEDKLRQQELTEANETLEQRVQERTRDLQNMTLDLDAAREEAERANTSKTRFLAAASHDLLQPLNAARLFLGAVKNSPSAGAEEVQQLLAKTDRSIQSADELLKGLLDVSRLDHSKVEPRPTILPLGPLLEDIADEARPMAEAAGLDIRVVPTKLAAQVDPDFAASILRNFLSNARRYTRNGGVLIGARRRGDKVRVEVWDTGPGISDDQQALIFEEFQRFEDTDNAGLRGAGLGLSIVRRMAAIMKSPIGVRSWLGRGSVFHVTFPLSSNMDDASFTLGCDQRYVSPLNGLKILCIDDEQTILDGMFALLSGWGCEVYTANSVSSAETVVSKRLIDVMIADLDIKENIDGLDLLVKLRPCLPHIDNAALLTARNNDILMARAEEVGISVLAKPVNPEAIRRFLTLCQERKAPYAAE